MMGKKERHFAPLIHISVEELVPQDHFYRHLERTLDLSFVREFVQETYAGRGRPSIVPVVFFKLQLVMFFERIRSERQLIRHAADRMSVRWYVGYDLNEPLPDHSSLTRIRERYGVDSLRRFRLRLLWRVNCKALRIAAGQNLKRLLKKRGWRRRPFPTEAICASFWVLLRDVLVLVLDEWSFVVRIGLAYSMVRTYCVSLY